MNDQGLMNNEWQMWFIPNRVEITNGTFTVKIPMHRFKEWAKWFMEDNPILEEK